MTFKEELEAQGKRLADAQKRYFASQPHTEIEKEDRPSGDVRPEVIRPDYVAFSGISDVRGTSMAEPKIICKVAHHSSEWLNTKVDGKIQDEHSAQHPLSKRADTESVQEDEPGFTIHLTIVPSQPPLSSRKPPLNAEFILHLLLRHDEHDALIGDLIERYGKKCARLGQRRANLWFYAEILWTALPLLKRALVKVSGLVAFGEWVRRHVL